MKIIPPYRISGEILALINEAKSYLVLVSPYVNFNRWETIRNDLERAKQRGVKITVYVRHDPNNFESWETIERMGIRPRLIKNLHTKMYFNEKVGIVTSMNLLASSNSNAIEFGTLFDDSKELNELKIYVKEYLEPVVQVETPNEEELYFAKERFHLVVARHLSHYFNRNVRCWWKNGTMEIQSNNQYFFDIDKTNHTVWITGILSGKERTYFDSYFQKIKQDLAPYELYHTGEPDCMGNAVLKINKPLSSSNADYLRVNEKKEILEAIHKFIDEISTYKMYIFERRKELH